QYVYQDVNMEKYTSSLATIEKMLKEEGVNEDYKKSMKLCLKLISNILKNDSKKGVFFYGNSGVGKTFLLKAISKEYAKKGKKIIFTTVETLLSTLKNAMSLTSTVNEVLTVQNCKYVDVL